MRERRVFPRVSGHFLSVIVRAFLNGAVLCRDDGDREQRMRNPLAVRHASQGAATSWGQSGSRAGARCGGQRGDGRRQAGAQSGRGESWHDRPPTNPPTGQPPTGPGPTGPPSFRYASGVVRAIGSKGCGGWCAGVVVPPGGARDPGGGGGGGSFGTDGGLTVARVTLTAGVPDDG